MNGMENIYFISMVLEWDVIQGSMVLINWKNKVGCTLSIEIMVVLWKSNWIVLRTASTSLNDTECIQSSKQS